MCVQLLAVLKNLLPILEDNLFFADGSLCFYRLKILADMNVFQIVDVGPRVRAMCSQILQRPQRTVCLNTALKTIIDEAKNATEPRPSDKQVEVCLLCALSCSRVPWCAHILYRICVH